MSIVERSFRASDTTPAREREMIGWCIDRGGDQFSFSIVGIGSASSHQPLLDDLAAFYDGEHEREHMTTYAGDGARRRDTWRLSRDSVAALEGHIAGGVFAEPVYSADWWVEDFTVYRRGEIMLGVVSHEDYVLVRATELEVAEFSELMPQDHTTI